MSLRDYFESIGARLRNYRWSWGAVRPTDGAVVLRVWQDEELRLNDKTLMRLTNHAAFRDSPGDLGFQERLNHIELIRDGATCYLVMCSADDPRASPRSVKWFDSRTLFLAGGLLDIDGDSWIELGRRVQLTSLRPQPDLA